MNELFGKQAIRRQVNVLLLSLSVLVMAAGIADATHSPGQGSPKDLVSGTAEANLGGTTLIHLNARSGPAGEDPSGHFSLDDVIFGNQNVRGPITCLAVLGDSALVVGVVEKSQHSLFPEGFLVVIEITDMEEPSSDQLHFVGINMGFETTCADGSQLFITAQTCCVIHQGAADEFLSGNFVVHDALP